jgi:cyclic dehypoxanthinyl futalosine synthase
MIEENVVRAAGVAFHSKNIEDFVHIAKKLGRPVAKRDTLYNIIESYQSDISKEKNREIEHGFRG